MIISADYLKRKPNDEFRGRSYLAFGADDPQIRGCCRVDAAFPDLLTDSGQDVGTDMISDFLILV